MAPFSALLATVLVAASSTTPVSANLDVRSLGHHAHAALTQLSHLPEIVGIVNPQGEIKTSTVENSKRSLWARYYGDSRGFTRPKPMVERRATLPNGWTDLGCVTEGTKSRTLSSLSYIDSNLTPEGCMTTCLSRGYTYAGVEWSDECYCGSEFEDSGGAPGNGCVNKCAGDDTQTCGGNYFLNAYQYSAPSSACNATEAVSSALASASAVSSAIASASAASSAIASASASGFSSIRASASASLSGSPTATSSAAVATSSSGVTTEWEYMGCFWDNPADNNNLHLLQGSSLTNQDNMTPSLCQSRCAAQGYNFAGLEYGGECYCGDVSQSELAGFKANEPWCDQACTGDASQTCGGGWSLAIYEQVDVSDDC